MIFTVFYSLLLRWMRIGLLSRFLFPVLCSFVFVISHIFHPYYYTQHQASEGALGICISEQLFQVKTGH